MRLDRLEIEGFKKLAGRHAIEPAPLGITVVWGDNEAGKSTVLEALKAAFFTRHNATGEAREKLRPLAGGATPEVSIAFSLAGSAYVLEKRFRRNGVRLTGPDCVLETDAAEHALARLLTYDLPSRGPAKAEQMGIAGLFWVDQATILATDQAPSATARARLGPALAGEVAAFGKGERLPRLVERVRQRKDGFWHASRDQAKGELLALEQLVARLQGELAAAEAAEREVEARLEELADAIERRREWRTADRIGRARKERERTRETLAGVRDLSEACRLAQAREEARRAEHRRLEEKLAQRRERARQCQELEDGRRRNATGQAALADERRAAERRKLAAEAAEEAARIALEQEAAHGRVLALTEEKLRLARELARLRRAVEAAETAARDAGENAAREAAEPIGETDVAALERLESAIGESRAALRAVATRIELRPDRQGASAMADGRPIDPARPIELVAPTRLRLDGFGEITVIPGGQRIDELRAALRKDETALAAKLAALGAADIAAARRRLLVKRQQGQAALAARQRLAELLADNGVADLAALGAARERIAARLALIDEQSPAEMDEAELEAALARHERALAGLRKTHERQARQLAEALAAEAETERRAALLESEGRRLGQAIAALEDQLAVLRQEIGDEALALELAAAKEAVDGAALETARLERLLATADPETARRAAEQAERLVVQIEAEATALDRRIEGLEGEVRGLEAKGIGERRATLQGRLELEERRLARLRREAEAWRLLLSTLETVEKSRQDALAEPLRARLQPYLKALMGDAAPIFDAGRLALDGLRRAGIEEPFGGLSVGTREQLAILVRLALGDLLHEAEGESPPLILDDALVYADAARLGRMKAILERAAERRQIIILTCRKEDYLGLDARFLALADCRDG